jgi:hypothetical protein
VDCQRTSVVRFPSASLINLHPERNCLSVRLPEGKGSHGFTLALCPRRKASEIASLYA